MFARRLEDIPATMRHHVKGVIIDPNKIDSAIISEGVLDIAYWKHNLEHLLIEHNRRMKTLRVGTALQGTMQALLMMEGLYSRAVKIEQSLLILQSNIASNGKLQEDSSSSSSETSLQAALVHLQPYYDGKKFQIDFEPPFYLLSQN